MKALKGAFNYFLVGKADYVVCSTSSSLFLSTQPESFEYKTTRQTVNSPGAKCIEIHIQTSLISVHKKIDTKFDSIYWGWFFVTFDGENFLGQTLLKVSD